MVSLRVIFPSGESLAREVAVQAWRMVAIVTISLSALVLLLAACGTPVVGRDSTEPAPSTRLSGSMKGYELYSWQTGEDWHFSLLVGTNRLKTPDEISAAETRLEGLEALERELDKLPEGEQVFWSAKRVRNTTLPPDEMINVISAYCRDRGILLTIERLEATRPERLPELTRGELHAVPDMKGRDRSGYEARLG